MAVIDSKKLLPSGKPGGAIAESQRPLLVPASNISYKKSVDISQKLLKPADRETQGPGGSLVVIKKNVLEIKDIISNMYLLQRSEDNRKRKLKERQEAEEREKQLEKKPEAKEDPNKLPKISLPGRGILDTINRFLAFTFAGFLINNYSKYLPKLLEFVKYITPVTDFIGSFAKNLVNGVITFVDLGYKAYDQVNKTIESIGGKDAAKTFDDFSSKLNVLLNGSIAAAMLIASTAPKKIKPKIGFDRLGRRVGQDTQRRYLQRYGERQFADRFGKKNLQKLATSGATKGIAKGAARQSLRSVVGVPIIGSLIGFVIDTVVFREKPTRAAAGAVGSAVGQGIGIALAGGTTFGLGAGVGMFIGGFLGDIIGKSLYDSFAGSNPEPTQAKAQGGQVRGGQSTVAPTRRITAKPTSRRVSYTPTKVQPGKDAGGKFKIEELYGKDEPGKRSALRALKKSSDDVKKMRSLSGVAGGMLGAGIDMALGQKPDRKLANSLGSMFGSVIEAAVNAELNSSFNDITRTIAMANGGVVPSREIGSGMSIGEKIGKYISNAFAIALESSAAKVLRNLNQELNLEGGPAGSPDVGGPMGPIEYGPLPLNMTQKQAFATIYELAKKHNAAMPELVAAMAMNESGYLSSLLARQYNNPFGQTGVGTKGSTRIPGNSRTFAVYNSLSDAVKFHVEKWNNDSSYGKGAGTYANAVEGLKAILPTYDPGGNHSQYLKNAASILSTMGFDPQKKNPAVNLSTSALIQQRKSTAPGMIPGQTIAPSSGYKPSTPGLFNAIQYITGDTTQSANYKSDHGGGNYHEHIAFRTEADKERAKTALRAAGFVLGSEYRAGDPGYHGSNLAIDVPFYGQTRRYSDNTAGEQKFSADIRRILGLGGSGGVTLRQPKRSQLQASIGPTPSSTSSLLASVQQNPSYSQGGSMIIHDINNIVMPVMVG